MILNKRRAHLQRKLGHPGTTKRMERLTNKRNRRIDHYLHTVGKRVIDLLVNEGIGTLIIGKNDGWKQEANLGKRNNQNVVHIPHARFIAMLTYKAELVGITVKLTEESYTSQASLLDLDPLPGVTRTRTKRSRRFVASVSRVDSTAPPMDASSTLISMAQVTLSAK